MYCAMKSCCITWSTRHPCKYVYPLKQNYLSCKTQKHSTKLIRKTKCMNLWSIECRGCRCFATHRNIVTTNCSEFIYQCFKNGKNAMTCCTLKALPVIPLRWRRLRRLCWRRMCSLTAVLRQKGRRQYLWVVQVVAVAPMVGNMYVCMYTHIHVYVCHYQCEASCVCTYMNV